MKTTIRYATSEDFLEAWPDGLPLKMAEELLMDHKNEPLKIWDKDRGNLLICLIAEEVICEINDHDEVDTESLLNWIGY